MPAPQAKSLIASHSLMSQEIWTFQRNREQRKTLKLNSIILANQIVMLHIWVLPRLSLWETVTVQIYNFTMNLKMTATETNTLITDDLCSILFKLIYRIIQLRQVKYKWCVNQVQISCNIVQSVIFYG